MIQLLYKEFEVNLNRSIYNARKMYVTCVVLHSQDV